MTTAATLAGMSAETAAPLDGIEHLRQSITDILTTPIGSRVMRPEYGSRVFSLIDRPVNPEFLVDLYYEAIVAIRRWEPRIRVIRLRASEVAQGRIMLDMEAVLKLRNERIDLTGLVVRRNTPGGVQ